MTRDPIFTPLFTALIGSATIGATSLTYAGLASAIASTSKTKGISIA